MPNPTTPLQPFAPPAGLALTGLAISPGLVVEIIAVLVFVFWALYTSVAIYHWLQYSHGSKLAFPAIAMHLIVSFLLASYALSGAL